ncbi:MAG: hypothetical protein NZ524_02350 [Thiobacillaceae bacterium]|nr:hypothetical protein [Thiobacillaceae bacterium]
MHRPDPLTAFENALIRRGYAPDAVERRLALARRILAATNPADPVELRYRLAVERVLIRCGNSASLSWCQRIARDFHPFYVDAGSPCQPEAHPAVLPPPIELELPDHDGLDDLIRQALAHRPSADDAKAIAAYRHELKQARLDRRAVFHRMAIARLIVLALRGRPRDGRHFRAAVERLLPLFTHDETRSYFLGVAREFHPHLCTPAPSRTDSGDPMAQAA